MPFRICSGTAVTIAALAFATPASATPVVVTFNVAALGAFTSDTGNLATATTISNAAPDLIGAISGSNNIGVVSGSSVIVSPAAMPVTVGGTFTVAFSSSFGSFLETLTVVSRTPASGSLQVEAQGTITEVTYVSGPVFDATPVYWSAFYVQNAGPGSQINGGFKNSTTPPQVVVAVPEPASLAIMSLALAGLGVAIRRNRPPVSNEPSGLA